MRRNQQIAAGLLPVLLFSGCTGAGRGQDRSAPTVSAQTQGLTAPPDPAQKPYFNFFEQRSEHAETFNTRTWDHGTRTIQIAGKLLIIDQADANQLKARLDEEEDIRRLDLYAETIVFRTRLHLPGTEVHLYAETVRFEDPDPAQPISALDTTPTAWGARATNEGQAGQAGQNGGDVYVYAKSFSSQNERYPRFVLNGGKGQQGGPGRPGDPGESRTRLALQHADLVTCGKTYGLSGPLQRTGSIGINPTYQFTDAGLTASELELNTVNLDQELPTDGMAARTGGRAGNASNGGNFHSLFRDLSAYTQRNPGAAGDNAGYFAGGKVGTPTPAAKVKTAVCATYYKCGNAICTSQSSTGLGLGGTLYPTVKKLVVTGVTKRTPVAGASVQSPNATVPFGQAGTATIDSGTFAWVHPHAVAMTIAFAEDAYANDFRELAQTELAKEESILAAYEASPEYAALADADRTLLSQQALRVRTLLAQLAANQDYWANPRGWVPALSLEANLALFQQETEWAIRSIFVSDWLTDENNRQKDKTAALATAKTLLNTEIGRLQQQFNDALARIPGLKADAADSAAKQALLTSDLQAIEAALTAEAQHNVDSAHQLPFWKKALKVLAVVAKAIPIGQPAVGVAGAVLGTIIDFDSDQPWASLGAGFADVVGAFKDTDLDEKGKAVKDKTEEQKPEQKKKKSELEEAVSEIGKTLGPVVKALKEQKDLFGGASVKKEELDKEVAAELKKLEQKSAIYQQLTREIKELGDARNQLAKSIEDTTDKMSKAATRLTEDYLQVAQLLPELDDAAAVVLSQRSELALGDLKATALRRLEKYQYLLSRAYEYRRLQKYPGDLTLTNLLTQLTALVQASGSTGALQAAEYDSLYAIYRNELSAIVAEVADAYSNGNLPGAAPVTYDLSADELARLNAGLPVTFDFWERGAFQPNEEDVRITGFEILGLSVTQTGTGDFAYVDLETDHSGDSRIWKNGQVAVFQHYNDETTEPLHWSTRWQDGVVTQHQLAPSAQSLLHALLPDASADISLFSAPSAWATLTLRKLVHGGPGVDFTINSARIRLTYDYAHSPAGSSYALYRGAQNAGLQGIYQALLARPATDEELRSGRLLLDHGYSSAQVQEAILHATEQEYWERQASGIYDQLYQRAPTDDERTFWASELSDGRPDLQVRSYVQLITETFQEIYGRAPRYAELQLYTELLDEGVPL